MNEGVPTYISRQMTVRKIDPKNKEHRQNLADSARQNQCWRQVEQRLLRRENQIEQGLRYRVGRRVDVEHYQQGKHQAGSVDWSVQVSISQQQAGYR